MNLMSNEREDYIDSNMLYLRVEIDKERKKYKEKTGKIGTNKRNMLWRRSEIGFEKKLRIHKCYLKSVPLYDVLLGENAKPW